MAGKLKDITGLKFNRLTVIRCLGKISPTGRYLWECVCECGKIVNLRSDSLQGKEPYLSCGCGKSEAVSKSSLKHGHNLPGKRTSEYTTWDSMRQRCNNPNNTKYILYGDRGITVCERWNMFENFLADMGPKPTPKHSIERIDSNGNYEPSNCKWATSKEQARNTTQNVWIEYYGKKMLRGDLAERLNTTIDTIKYHLKKGRDIYYVESLSKY